MKPLFLTGSLVHGGAERHTITLLNRLAERGHECHLAYIKDDSSQLARLRGAASVQCLHARRYLDRRSLDAAARLIVRLRPSHLVAVNQYALLYAWLARRAAGAAMPLAVTFHTTELRTAKERLKMLYYRPLFRRAECVVFVCDAQRRYWAERGVHGRHTDVIHNGIDLDAWRPVAPEAAERLRNTLGFARDELVIGMSAVLRPEKNHIQMLQALAALRRRGLPARALFIGDGPMRAAIEAEARALGVAEHLRITGLTQDVRPLVGACDVLALCSTAVETFSLAALEAMALGKPVVQSDIGGAREMTRPGEDGFLFPVGDTAALVERLAALADPAVRLRMGAQARSSVEQRFSESVMVERYEQALLRLASPGREAGRAKRALRVLFVAPGAIGGAHMPFVRREAEALRAAGHEVEIFAFDNASYLPWHIAREAARLRAEVRRLRPDVVHAQFGKFNALVAALAAWSAPLVITFRGTDINRNTRYSAPRAAFGVLASQLAAFCARGVVCVSREIASKVWARHGRPCVVLPTGVDVQAFAPIGRAEARARLGFREEERIVLFNAGRNPAVKDPALAEAAVAQARRRVPDLRYVVLDGTLPPEEVPLYMNAADVLLLTSRTEGSPTVVQEAMACNLPVVAVDVGDVRERLAGVSHCAVLERDPGALGTALAELLAAPRRSDGRRHALALSVESIAARLTELYGSLLSHEVPSAVRPAPIGSAGGTRRP